MEKDECEYCIGKPYKRKELMYTRTSDYKVIINDCNYLEDNVVGGTVPHSVYGIKINFCPMCGRNLEKDNTFYKGMTYEEFIKASLQSWVEDNKNGTDLPSIVKKVLETSYKVFNEH